MIYIFVAIVIVVILVATSGKENSPIDDLFCKASDILSPFGRGFSLGGGLRATSQQQAFRNALIAGSTGSFKTSAILISSIFSLLRSRKSSIVVLDVGKVIFNLTSGFAHKRKKRRVICVDLSETSDGLNPFDLCKNLAAVEKMVHVLLKNSGVSSSDTYWMTAAEMITNVFAQYIYLYASPECRNMANVVLLMEVYMAEPQRIDKLFLQTRDEKLLRAYKTVNAIPDRQRQSVLATALAATKIFKSTEVSRVTAKSTFDISTFRDIPSILYLSIPLNKVAFLAPLTAVFFELFFDEALSRIPDKSENALFVLIDELVTMRLDLGLVYSTCRKYRMGCLSCIQDEKMLLMKYSAAESYAIKSNSCCRVYLPGQSIETCRELQEIIGKCIVKGEDGKERQVYGMEAAQIRTSKEAIVLVNSELPLRLKVIPYFEHFIYHSRTKIPPYEQEVKLDFTEPALLKID